MYNMIVQYLIFSKEDNLTVHREKLKASKILGKLMLLVCWIKLDKIVKNSCKRTLLGTW